MTQCQTQQPDDRRIAENWVAKCWLVDHQAKEQYVSAIA